MNLLCRGKYHAVQTGLPAGLKVRPFQPLQRFLTLHRNIQTGNPAGKRRLDSWNGVEGRERF